MGGTRISLAVMGAATVAAALMEHVAGAAVIQIVMVAAAITTPVVETADMRAAMVAAANTGVVRKATVGMSPAQVATANMARVREAIASTDVVIPFGPRRRISPAHTRLEWIAQVARSPADAQQQDGFFAVYSPGPSADRFAY